MEQNVSIASIDEIMTREVATIQRGQPLSEARKLLDANRFHHVPVLDGKKLVGMLSFTDLVRLVWDYEGVDERAVDAVLDHSYTVDKVMSKDLVTVTEGASIPDAARLLADGSIHALPVIDPKGGLAGIVTTTDMVRYLMEQRPIVEE